MTFVVQGSDEIPNRGESDVAYKEQERQPDQQDAF